MTAPEQQKQIEATRRDAASSAVRRESVGGAPSGMLGGLRRRIARERLLLLAAGCAAAVGVTLGIAAAAPPASAAPTVAVRSVVAGVSSATPSPGTKEHTCAGVLLTLKHDYDRLPDALRKDVSSAAHQSSKTAKRDAVQGILKKAQSGGYGAAVESAAHDKKTLAGLKAAWDRLPSSLRDDVKKARSATGDARIADVKAIAAKAESGGYGERVKDAASKVKDRLARCEARANGSTSKPTPSAPSTSTPSTSAPSPSTVVPTPTTGA